VRDFLVVLETLVPPEVEVSVSSRAAVAAIDLVRNSQARGDSLLLMFVKD